LGPQHPDTIWAADILAGLCSAEGRHIEAERNLREVLKKRQQKLGPDHPVPLTTMGNLAITLGRPAPCEEAELMGRELLEKTILLFGPAHLKTDRPLSILAETL
ncbi:hypothetical protein BDV98DRAFT_486267, partial [Pterulicium gracile]